MLLEKFHSLFLFLSLSLSLSLYTILHNNDNSAILLIIYKFFYLN